MKVVVKIINFLDRLSEYTLVLFGTNRKITSLFRMEIGYDREEASYALEGT